MTSLDFFMNDSQFLGWLLLPQVHDPRHHHRPQEGPDLHPPQLVEGHLQLLKQPLVIQA